MVRPPCTLRFTRFPSLMVVNVSSTVEFLLGNVAEVVTTSVCQVPTSHAPPRVVHVSPLDLLSRQALLVWFPS
jgi:hypothetical protein